MNEKNFRWAVSGIFILSTIVTLTVFGLGAWLAVSVIHWIEAQ